MFNLFRPNVPKLTEKHNINGLIKAFRWKRDSGESVAAARALADIGGLKGERVLLKAIADPDDVGHEAARTVADRIPGSKAFSLIATIAADHRIANWHRQWAAETLAKRKDEGAAAILAKLLCDSTLDYRFKIAQALGELGDALTVKPLITAALDRTDDPTLRQCSFRSLAQLGKEGTHALVQMFNDPQIDKWSKRECIDALAHVKALGEAPVEHLLTPLLQNEDLRYEAAKALACQGSAGIEHLIRALTDEDKGVRRSAVEALKDVKDTAVATSMIDLLANEEGTLLWAARHFFEKLGNDGVDALITALEHSRPMVRQNAVGLLGDPKISNQRAKNALLSILGDDDEGVRTRALDALGKSRNWTDQALAPVILCLADTRLRVRTTAAGVLAEHSAPQAIDTLLELLKVEDYEAQQNAALALGATGDPRVVDPILSVLKSLESKSLYDKKARRTIWFLARTLAKLGDRRATETIIHFEDVFRLTPHEATEILDELGDPAAVGTLIRYATRKEELPAVKALEKLLTRKPSEISDDDLQSLAKIKAVSYTTGDDDHGYYKKSYNCPHIAMKAAAELRRRRGGPLAHS